MTWACSHTWALYTNARGPYHECTNPDCGACKEDEESDRLAREAQERRDMETFWRDPPAERNVETW